MKTFPVFAKGPLNWTLPRKGFAGLWPHANVPWTTACTATNRAPHPAIGAVRVEPAIGFALQAFVLPET